MDKDKVRQLRGFTRAYAYSRGVRGSSLERCCMWPREGKKIDSTSHRKPSLPSHLSLTPSAVDVSPFSYPRKPSQTVEGMIEQSEKRKERGAGKSLQGRGFPHRRPSHAQIFSCRTTFHRAGPPSHSAPAEGQARK